MKRPMVGKLWRIPGGDEGVRQTLRRMEEIAREYSKHPTIIRLSRSIIHSCPVKDFTCEARQLFEWVRDNIRWTRDVYGVETLATPIRTLEMASGDCDDMSTLLASLYLAVGFPVRFVVVANNPKYPKSFSHVFVEVDVTGEGDWVPADPSHPRAKFGWQVPTQYRRMEWEIS